MILWRYVIQPGDRALAIASQRLDGLNRTLSAKCASDRRTSGRDGSFGTSNHAEQLVEEPRSVMRSTNLWSKSSGSSICRAKRTAPDPARVFLRLIESRTRLLSGFLGIFTFTFRIGPCQFQSSDPLVPNVIQFQANLDVLSNSDLPFL